MRASRVTALLAAALLLGLAPTAAAQVQRGAIFGIVTDASGAVLPGAVVQLTSPLTGTREAVAGSEGEFRFDNLDPGRYTLRATLAGFTPLVRENVVVGVGTTVDLRMEMSVAGVQEEVKVTAETPTLDVRTQGNVANFDQQMLNEVPTARDPWVLLQFVPGVQLDRINVGGSESGQQSVFAARGDDGSNTMWNVDGVTITDPAAIGSSPTYYDYSTFEEVQFTTSGLDPRQQTAGLGINFVTKRGTNDFHGQARMYFTNHDLQAANIPSDL
ncbi:MAG TPA: TonB-dependent receptor, partial [Vicinamibacterales bacterium]|nr:TonB-dependent receptor [Vicinamibacterales bacterium]